MKIEDVLAPDDVLIDVRTADKSTLLADLSKRAARALGIDQALFRGELIKREDLGSTGVGAGLVIPHARIPGVERPYGMLARLAKTIEFAAIDGKPVDIVFLLLLPAASSGDQLNALASATRKLPEPACVTQDPTRRLFRGALCGGYGHMILRRCCCIELTKSASVIWAP